MTTLIHYAGRAGDHNDSAMAATPILADELASRLGTKPVVVGKPESFQNASWEEELKAAKPTLHATAEALEEAFKARSFPVIACSRCSVALATLPVVAKRHPDVVVVWFDAHADLNTPDNSASGYLGGMALSGPMGLWESGFGSGIKTVILAGTRDIDDTEKPLIQRGKVALVPPGEAFSTRLIESIAGRPVFIHVDCDVLSPGQMPTDYSVPLGLRLGELAQAAREIAEGSEVVGIEIGEFQCAHSEAETKEKAKLLVDVLEPLVCAAK